jgi:hypothetical protein
MLSTDPGFRVTNVHTLSTNVPPSARQPGERTAIYRRMEEKLLAIPGVRKVAAVSRLPLLGSQITSQIHIEGKVFPPDASPETGYRVATAGYFAAMGIPLRVGRFYDARDDERPVESILINEALGKKYFPGEDPIGKRVKFGPKPDGQPWSTIIGVVGNVRHLGLDIATATGNLPPVCRESEHLADPRGADRWRRESALDAGGGSRGESGNPDLRCLLDGTIGRARCRAPAIPDAAAGQPGGLVAAAGRRGTVWRAGRKRHPAAR